jgi:hypothetical protein
MPASEARIRANQANGAKSQGPMSEAGKARSRANSYKHGLTGAGIVMPEDDAAEVERLSRALQDEFKTETPSETQLAHRMATMSVRMQRCVNQETAKLSQRVRRVMAEFQAPEGVDAVQAERLRIEAGNMALFDDSKEGILARKYEAAAERCFFRSLKELRQLKQVGVKEESKDKGSAAMLAQVKTTMSQLGSFLPAKPKPPAATPKPQLAPSKPVHKPIPASLADWDPFAPTHFDVPIAVGKLR